MTLAENSLEIALSQEGVCEEPKGSNGGPEVTQYLRAVGLNAGFAWCMAFVYWCVNKAAADMLIPNPLIKTAGVLRQWTDCKLRKLPKTSSGVKPGDIFILRFANGMGHCGFVYKINDGIIYTIEGNTNEDGSREGFEVAKRARPVSSIYGFIQLA